MGTHFIVPSVPSVPPVRTQKPDLSVFSVPSVLSVSSVLSVPKGVTASSNSSRYFQAFLAASVSKGVSSVAL